LPGFASCSKWASTPLWNLGEKTSSCTISISHRFGANWEVIENTSDPASQITNRGQMGYKTNNPGKWQKKQIATTDEIDGINELLNCSYEWYELTDRRWNRWCKLLGYPRPESGSPIDPDPTRFQGTRTSSDWIASFKARLLTNEEHQVRRSILQLRELEYDRKRVDLVLLYLYLLAQVMILSILYADNNSEDPKGRPHNELRGNFRNIFHHFLRMITSTCGHYTEDTPRANALTRALAHYFGRRFVGEVIEPSKRISKNAVAGWTRVAVRVNGGTFLDTTIVKMWDKAAMPASKALRLRAKYHFRVLEPRWEWAIWIPVDICGLYYLVTHIAYLYHGVRHLLNL
jgi:hypothetical protein